MITVSSDVRGRQVPHEFFGLSTDTKPVDEFGEGNKVTNGSIFIEIDTKKVYMFDAENKVWIEQ